jgi:hypothetical protein
VLIRKEKENKVEERKEAKRKNDRTALGMRIIMKGKRKQGGESNG